MCKKIIYLIIFLNVVCLNAYYYGRNKIQPEKIEWSVIESRHFDVHYVRGHDEFGQLTVLMAENAFYHLNQFFQQPLKKRIPIIVYSSKQEFQATNIIYPLLTEGIGGFTETIRNHVALPFDGSYKKFEEILTHELTHAYINDLDGSVFKNPLGSSSSRYIPFWLAEGLPEYLSVNGKSIYNNMFIKDMVLNDQIYDLEYIGGYFAYRLGEAILVYLSQEYSPEKVVEFFYNIRTQSDINRATEKTFGFDWTELQKRFRLHLKRQHDSLLLTHKAPWEESTRHTNAHKSYEFQNIFPRYNPAGDAFAFFSSNKGRTTINLGTPHSPAQKGGGGGSENQKPKTEHRIILTGERTGTFEEFHFQRNNISWFPDGRHIAFVSKTTNGDVIYYYDTQRRKISQKLTFPQMDAIYELDISHNGKMLAFTAQKANRCDLYIYDNETQELLQLTDELYFSYSPKWSPDGTKLAFVSERSRPQTLENYELGIKNYEDTHLIFSSMTQDIYYFDLSDNSIYQVTSDSYENFFPVWAGNQQIMFITERENIANIDIIDLEKNQRAEVTKVLTGIHSFDYHIDSESLIYTTYHENAFDIFSMKYKLEILNYEEIETNTRVDFVDDFHTVFNTDEYKLHGRVKHTSEDRPQTSEPRPRNTGHQTPNTEHQTLHTIPRDSLRTDFFKYFSRSFTLEPRPDSTTGVVPMMRHYRPKFQIDSFWGGLAYSPSYGTVGVLQLGLSDLMGDHGLGVNMDFNGTLKESNLVFSYMYLPHRIDYGFAGYNFRDEYVVRHTLLPTHPLYEDFYLRETEYYEYRTGGFLLLRYPLSRFFRFDFENSIYRYRLEKHLFYMDRDGVWYKDTDIEKYSSIDYMPQVSFVFDNALYGSVGPMSGYKLTSILRQSFSTTDNSFTTFYSDWRSYYPLTHRFSVANRIVFGASEGKNPENFRLTGFNGVRGYNNDKIRGERIAMASMELRYPLIDRLQMTFPLPITMSNVRGSIFADVGTLWNKNLISVKDYQIEEKLTYKDLKLGIGFGPRVNIGYFILKFDFAWDTSNAENSFYFSINSDF